MKTKLVEINPPLRPGQTIACSGCGHMSNKIRAHADVPGTFYCEVCKPRTEEP